MSEIIDIAMEGMKQQYEQGKEHALALLKYPHAIVEFIDSCGFTCDDLSRIIAGIEDLKGSDYEDGKPDDFDRTDELREQNGEFDKL